jgi:A/G-specific adenine glycosylase
MMDLGATLCTRRNPACTDCPLVKGCAAYRAGTQHQYPSPKPKTHKPERSAWFAILQKGSQVLLEKRPPNGIWGGLWSLPQAESKRALHDWLAPWLPEVTQQQSLAPFRHTFSHFHLQIQPIRLQLRSINRVMDDRRFKWQDLNRLDRLGLPGPIAKLLQSLPDSTQESS